MPTEWAPLHEDIDSEGLKYTAISNMCNLKTYSWGYWDILLKAPQILPTIFFFLAKHCETLEGTNIDVRKIDYDSEVKPNLRALLHTNSIPAKQVANQPDREDVKANVLSGFFFKVLELRCPALVELSVTISMKLRVVTLPLLKRLSVFPITISRGSEEINRA
ncbi:hypothetical protein M422DRAFT_247763 [Sphaerobolus stellatus SS14]|nr:hypothetical protein M422DRAFT_247763 [Sphaerobolus stellatus SS14]